MNTSWFPEVQDSFYVVNLAKRVLQTVLPSTLFSHYTFTAGALAIGSNSSQWPIKLNFAQPHFLFISIGEIKVCIKPILSKPI